jgi:hypothetical protein
MTVLAGLLIVGTIYLRYHYVVDLIGGAIFFLFTIWSGKKIQTWWEGQFKKDQNERIFVTDERKLKTDNGTGNKSNSITVDNKV